MAKIRVYELARLLNMTNQMLLDKIQELDSSQTALRHTSGLEDDLVALVKDSLVPKRGNVEERRIGGTIIRRRKKNLPDGEEEEAAPQSLLEEPEVSAPAPVEQAPEPIPAEEKPDQEPVEAPISEAAPPSLEQPVAAEEPVVPEPPPAPEAPMAPKPAPEPAGLAHQALEEEPAMEQAAMPEPPAVPEPQTQEPPQAGETAQIVESAPARQELETAVPETAAPAEEPQPAAEESSKEDAAAGEQDKSKAAKPKRKRKKEFAAKIIKLPDRIVTPPGPQPEKPAQIVTDAPATDKTPARPLSPREAAIKEAVAREAEAREKKKKKKGKKKEEEPETDARFFKKKISFRKKEVIEGADLYDKESPRLRKGKKGQKEKAIARAQKTMQTVPKAIKRRIRVDDAILLSDLAKRMGVKASELIKSLMAMGTLATMNQSIDFETASLLATEFNYEAEKAAFEEESVMAREEDTPETLQHRPPVVTIMGHVDHGKTSLLDAIRQTHVTDKEAGGITQHIGAYLVDVPKGKITFLDTPGHEAFTAMRQRGAQVTDIVILVVAADDGVMPQTIEAINHSKAADVPIIVAINKMDKPDANPERVTRQLADQGLSPEAWGGETIYVEVSAKQKLGLNELLEMILLQAEVLELAANPDKLAFGHVVEARVDPGRGPVATVLVQDGTLHVGDSVVCGLHYGKIRAMSNDHGEHIAIAGPSFPAEILGLSGVPMAGDELMAVANEKIAKQVSTHRQQKQRLSELAQTSRPTLENLFEHIGKGERKDLNLILKADVQGSIEALRESLEKLSGDKVKITVIHSATGAVTESDVALAAVSQAIILSFNVRPNAKVQDMAQTEGVDIRFYDVIYNVIADIKAAVLGMMESTYKEHVLGRAQVRDTFTIPKVGTIAGSHVVDGKIERGSKVRLIRDSVVIYDGKLGSLKRFKEDAKEVVSGYDCGIGIENFNDIKVGDVIEAYFLEEIKPVLE